MAAPSQLFRVSLPQDVAAPNGVAVNGLAVGGVAVLPPRALAPLRPAKVKLANTQNNELWVLLVDRRSPNRPLRIKIPPAAALTIALSRDPSGAPQVLYELSVYELIRQSVVIDSTDRGRGAVTDENFSPRSVGWFEIPPGRGQADGVVDVYRLARRSRNPGRVVKIDVEEWADVTPGEVPAAAFDDAEVAQNDDPDSPFSDASQPPEQPASPGLRPHLLSLPQDQPNQAPTPPPLGLVQRSDEGAIHVELMNWIQQEVTYDVSIPVTKQVEVDGKTVNVTEQRMETRTRLQPMLQKIFIDLLFHQIQVFLPNGTQLDEAATAQSLRTEMPAVVLRAGEQLDPRFLSSLAPATLIIVYDNQVGTSGLETIPDERRKQFPTTPIDFRCATLRADGDLSVGTTHPEQREVIEQVVVPVTESRIVDGKEVQVTVMISEERTKNVTVWQHSENLLPANSFRMFTMSGTRLAAADAAVRFVKPQVVVYVAPGAKVDPWYRKVMHASALLIAERVATAQVSP